MFFFSAGYVLPAQELTTDPKGAPGPDSLPVQSTHLRRVFSGQNLVPCTTSGRQAGRQASAEGRSLGVTSQTPKHLDKKNLGRDISVSR